MLNVTPLLSVNSSNQTSWGPGLWPCTPPVSVPEAANVRLCAHPPHLATGPSQFHKPTQQKPTQNRTHMHKDAHTLKRMNVCLVTMTYKVSVHIYERKIKSGTHI